MNNPTWIEAGSAAMPARKMVIRVARLTPGHVRLFFSF